MKVRCIKENELDRFINLENNDIHLKNTLNEWFKEGKTKLEWCLVVQENNRFLARVFCWRNQSMKDDFKIAAFFIKDGENVLQLGKLLLIEMIRIIKLNGGKILEYHLYSKNNVNFNEFQVLFDSFNFKKIQEKKSFNYSKDFIKHNYNRKLIYKSLKEVGEDAFIEAIELVSEKTLDVEDEINIKKIGAKNAAMEYYQILKEIDYNEDWWLLAYHEDDHLVGLVVPQKFSDTLGAINYIGVVVNERGNGYVNNLIKKATNFLIEQNVNKILADIDVSNYPLDKALNRNGYTFDGEMIVYNKELV